MRRYKLITLILCMFMIFNSINFCYAEDIEEPVQNEANNEETTYAYNETATSNGVTLKVEWNEPSIGTPTIFHVSASGGSGLYKFRMDAPSYTSPELLSYESVADPSRGEWLNYTEECSSTNYYFTMTATGTYNFRFYIMDSASSVYYLRTNIYINVSDPNYPSVYTIVQSAVANCNNETDGSDYQKALWLHDWLLTQLDYDNSLKWSSAESALTRGLGTCQAYESAYSKLLTAAGIENAETRSTYDGHTWNAMKLDGEWYQVDVTWDDSNDNFYGFDQRRLYFALTDELMAIAHKGHLNIYTADGYATRSTSLANNYFVKSGDAANWAENYRNRIQENLDAGKTDFSIKTDNSTFPPSIYGIQNGIIAYAINQLNWSSNGKPVTLYVVTNGANFDFTVTYQNEVKDIENAIIVKNDDFTLENPSITVTYEGIILNKDIDYTVSTTSDEYGTDVTITGINDYSNSKTITFISINKLTIKCKDMPFTGSEVEPEVTVTNELGTALIKDKDYTVSYSNNTNVGEDAKVTVTGIGDYYGSKEIKFQIYNDIGEQLKGFNLGLDGVIEFNVYIKMNNELANDPNAYILFTLPDNRSTVKQYVKNAYVQEEYGHMFTCGVYAQEITKKVSFQVFNGDGVGGKIYYRSVEDYTNTSLNSDKEHSIKVRPLIKALLNYGGYSQNLFNYNLEDMAYKNIKDELQTSMDNVTKDVLSKYKAIISGEESGVTKLGLSLSLDAATTLRYYFQIDSSIDISKLDVTVDGNAKEFAKDSNGYYLEVPYISSNKLDIVHTFQVGNLSIKCSALTYAYSSLNNNTNSKGMLVSKALYLYSEESKAYTG